MVRITLFDLQFVLNHLPSSYRVLSFPNVFGFPSSLCSRAVLSHVSSLIPPYAASPGFITPSARYEPNLNNVAAPHLVGRLISERASALIKNKPKKQRLRWTSQRKAGQGDMCQHTHACSDRACSLSTAAKQLQNALCMCWEARAALPLAPF